MYYFGISNSLDNLLTELFGSSLTSFYTSLITSPTQLVFHSSVCHTNYQSPVTYYSKPWLCDVIETLKSISTLRIKIGKTWTVVTFLCRNDGKYINLFWNVVTFCENKMIEKICKYLNSTNFCEKMMENTWIFSEQHWLFGHMLYLHVYDLKLLLIITDFNFLKRSLQTNSKRLKF